jgi:hypothetical protein
VLIGDALLMNAIEFFRPFDVTAHLKPIRCDSTADGLGGEQTV